MSLLEDSLLRLARNLSIVRTGSDGAIPGQPITARLHPALDDLAVADALALPLEGLQIVLSALPPVVGLATGAVPVNLPLPATIGNATGGITVPVPGQVLSGFTDPISVLNIGAVPVSVTQPTQTVLAPVNLPVTPAVSTLTGDATFTDLPVSLDLSELTATLTGLVTLPLELPIRIKVAWSARHGGRTLVRDRDFIAPEGLDAVAVSLVLVPVITTLHAPSRSARAIGVANGQDVPIVDVGGGVLNPLPELPRPAPIEPNVPPGLLPPRLHVAGSLTVDTGATPPLKVCFGDPCNDGALFVPVPDLPLGFRPEVRLPTFGVLFRHADFQAKDANSLGFGVVILPADSPLARLQDVLEGLEALQSLLLPLRNLAREAPFASPLLPFSNLLGGLITLAQALAQQPTLVMAAPGAVTDTRDIRVRERRGVIPGDLRLRRRGSSLVLVGANGARMRTFTRSDAQGKELAVTTGPEGIAVVRRLDVDPPFSESGGTVTSESGEANDEIKSIYFA